MLDYFENLSPLAQILIVFGALGLLFLVVLKNNTRNKNKLKRQKGRNFRERLNEKKKNR